MDSRDEDKAGWKAFDTNTEAGRLLHKLYGKQHKPQIVYPKLKQRATSVKGPYLPAGGKVNNQHQRSQQHPTRNSQRSVPVPNAIKTTKFQFHPIDHTRIRRKRAGDIEAELQQIKQRMEGYRLPNDKRVFDKAKLQQQHTFSPGTVLPKELLPSSQLLDQSLQYEQQSKGPRSRLTTLYEMQDAVANEIQERQQHVINMSQYHKGEAVAEKMQEEIDNRLTELDHIQRLIDKESRK